MFFAFLFSLIFAIYDDFISKIKTKFIFWSDKKLKESSPDKIQFYKENDTEYGDINHESYEIPTVDENGKTSWKKIEAVTRHPPPNVNGNFKLLHVKTKSGRSVTATASKSFNRFR